MAQTDLINKELTVEQTKSQLVISIGYNTLIHAVSMGRSYGLGEIKVTDEALFIKEIILELLAESEDGSTPVHEMFDDAVSRAIENGAHSAEYIED